MPPSLPVPVIDEVLARYPFPIAEAVGALAAADSVYEQRDRVIEVFRAHLRFLVSVALAARLQRGRGANEDDALLKDRLLQLKRRGLTDGQWWELLREHARGHASAPERHPLPELVRMVDDAKVRAFIDGLLQMRTQETIAHGSTGEPDAIAEILERRLPLLSGLLTAAGPLWSAARLVVPLSQPEGDESQRAWLLMGLPARGKWRRVELARGSALPPGQPVLVGPQGNALLTLHPLALFRRPSPESAEELFLLDRGHRSAGVYVALPSMSEHREVEAWEAVERVLASHSDEAASESLGGLRQPYRGLESFSSEHSPLFFGREALQDALANRIRRTPLVTVTGPSGGGKSSLLEAGVLPRLRSLRAADSSALEEGAAPLILRVRPGAQPLETLRSRMTAAAIEAAAGDSSERPGSWIRRWCERNGRTAILVVDQGEELFTLCKDPGSREVFAQAIADLGSDAAGPTRAVIVIREDYFARLETLRPLHGLIARDLQVVTQPGRDALLAALVRPAELFGFSFEDHALPTAIVDAVAAEPAALALLEFCADRLWEARDRTWKRLTWDAYRAMGGVEGALATHAEHLLSGLPPSQQRMTRDIFRMLVTPEGTRAVVQRQELLASVGADTDGASVLDGLIQARLLTVREGPGGLTDATVEVVHETLLTRWGRLRDWLNEDVEQRRARLRLAAAARRWREEGQAADLLLGEGKPLLEAEALVRDARTALSNEEKSFIAASGAGVRRRRQLKRAAIAGLAVLTVIALGFGAIARSGLRRAERAQAEAEAQREAAEQARYASLLAEARSVTSTDPTRAIALLKEIPPGSRLTNRVRLAAAAAADRGISSRLLTGAPENLNRSALSPDGKVLLAGGQDRVWWVDREAWTLQPVETQAGKTRTLAFAPDGQQAASGSEGGQVLLWDVARREFRLLGEHAATVWTVAFSRSGKLLASASADGEVRLWDLSAGGSRTLVRHSGRVMHVEFSPDDQWVSSASADTTARLSRVGTAESFVLAGHAEEVWQAVFSADGASLATVSDDGTVRLWSVAARTSQVFSGHRANVWRAVFAPGAGRLWTTGNDGTLRLWPGGNAFDCDESAAMMAAFSTDGRKVVVPTHQGTVCGVDLQKGFAIRRYGHGGTVYQAFPTPEDRIVSTGTDGDIREWSWSLAPKPRQLEAEAEEPVNMDDRGVWVGGTDANARVTPDGRFVAWRRGRQVKVHEVAAGKTTTLDSENEITALEVQGAQTLITGDAAGTVRSWAIPTGENRPLFRAGASVSALVVAGDQVVVGTAAGSVVALDPAGQQRWTASSGAGRVVALAAPLRGDWVAWAGEDHLVRIRLGSSDEPKVLESFATPVETLRASSDGRRLLALRAKESSIWLWEAESGRGRLLVGHSSDVHDAVFDPSGDRIASGALDQRVRAWDLASGEARDFMGHSQEVSAVAFLGDGDTVVSGGADGTLRIWDFESGDSRVLAGTQGIHGSLSVANSDGGAVIAAGLMDGRVAYTLDPVPYAPAAFATWLAASTNARLDDHRQLVGGAVLPLKKRPLPAAATAAGP